MKSKSIMASVAKFLFKTALYLLVTLTVHLIVIFTLLVYTDFLLTPAVLMAISFILLSFIFTTIRFYAQLKQHDGLIHNIHWVYRLDSISDLAIMTIMVIQVSPWWLILFALSAVETALSLIKPKYKFREESYVSTWPKTNRYLNNVVNGWFGLPLEEDPIPKSSEGVDPWKQNT